MTKEEIREAAAAALAASPRNAVAEAGGTRVFDAPILGIARAGDPLFEGLKAEAAVGPLHLLPGDWLPGARSVVSLFFPFTEEVRRSNRRPGDPSFEWLYGRIEGEALLREIVAAAAQAVRAAGGRALAPASDPRARIVDRRCNWSERHVAFVAGLGTFSLSRSLITEAGSAGRIGSLVTDLELEPTPRPYSGLEEYCSRCRVCAPRCPPRAIGEAGKDNAACSDYLDGVKLRRQNACRCHKTASREKKC